MGLLDTGDDPGNSGLLSFGFRLMSTPGKFGQALGTAGLGALGDMRQARAEMEQRKMREQAMQMQALQFQQAQREIAAQEQARLREEAFRKLIPDPQAQAAQAALSGGGGPTLANAARIAPVDPRAQLLYQAMATGQIKPMDYLSTTQKDDAPVKLGEGETLLSGRASGYGVLARGMPKASDTPAAIREYQFAVNQGYKGTFQDFQLEQKKAGATNIGLPRIEVKMGDSVAGQIGPMAKDSRTQAQGAVGMFDSADRIQKALDSGKVSAGPLTTQINTVKQLVQKVGGGNDEGIRQTRQVIKGLAQMSVEARKELAGQGAVTENEAAAVAKAESGDINDLTTGELQDLVTLTKRAAHFRAKSHQGLIDSMGASEATRGTVPFYQVRGLDRLLQHSPGLPQIGGKDTPSAFDDAEKERRYQQWKQQQGRP